MKALLINIFVLLVLNSIAQTYPRTANPNYVQTRLNDSFESLNPLIWEISNENGCNDDKSGIMLYKWINDPSTVSQNNGICICHYWN